MTTIGRLNGQHVNDSTQEFRYVAALDGVRAVAVLGVLAVHAGVPIQGGVGVYLFFSLSGFLITSLALAEIGRTGQFSLRGFYARRALRLFPAMVALVAVGNLAAWLLPEGIGGGVRTWWDSIPALFYYANWARAFGPADELGIYAHTWSLSIEEQFYLVWPLAIMVALWLRSTRVIAGVAVLGCLGAVVARLLVGVEDPSDPLARVYNGTDTNADHLLYGCLLAVAVHRANRRGDMAGLRRIANIAFWPAFAVLCGAWVLTRMSFTEPTAFYAIAITAIAMSCTAVVAKVFLSPVTDPLNRLLTQPAMLWIGVRSYGIYLWHWPVFILLGRAWDGSGYILAVVEVGASFIVAAMSYRYIERPFLRLKDRTRSRHTVKETDPSAT